MIEYIRHDGHIILNIPTKRDGYRFTSVVGTRQPSLVQSPVVVRLTLDKAASILNHKNNGDRAQVFPHFDRNNPSNDDKST